MCCSGRLPVTLLPVAWKGEVMAELCIHCLPLLEEAEEASSRRKVLGWPGTSQLERDGISRGWNSGAILVISAQLLLT